MRRLAVVDAVVGMINDTNAATLPPETRTVAERLSETKARRVYLILRDRISFLDDQLTPDIIA